VSVNEGDALSIRHYSVIKILKSVALKVDGDSLFIKLTDDFAKINLMEGDPLVCGVERENVVYTYGCTVVKIRAKVKSVELNIDSKNTSENRRQHERFPVSLYADIKFKDGMKNQLATVKDLSYYGVSLLTKVELNHNEIIELDIYIDKMVLYVKGNIVRRINHENSIEYGISMIYDEISTLNEMKRYIRELKIKQEQLVRNLLE
jgi:hypothetical protein